MSVNHGARSGGIIGIYFGFSLTQRYIVSSHENGLTEAILMSTHNIPENHPKLSQTCSYAIFFKGLKNEFETSVVNEPLKFYCILCLLIEAILMSTHNMPFSI